MDLFLFIINGTTMNFIRKVGRENFDFLCHIFQIWWLFRVLDISKTMSDGPNNSQ